MATTKTEKYVGIALVVGVLGLLWWKSRIVSKYAINNVLSLAGQANSFTIVGIWKVNGVASYIMENADVIGDVAYPVADVDASADWTKVG
jgi:hypothetical protein